MLGFAQKKQIGAVGAKLLYPNNQIQHAGILIGDLPFHAFKLFKDGVDLLAYNTSLYGIRNYLAVTAACMMISKKKFKEVSGFDEKLKIAFNDVDLCLKLHKKGYRQVYNGGVELYHYESISVGQPGTVYRDQKLYGKEVKIFKTRWKEYIQNDPYYNKNLSTTMGGYYLSFPRKRESADPQSS
jgi:GT2 family glycosyltransferase